MRTKNQKSINIIEWLCNKAGIEYEIIIVTLFAYLSLL